jgi:apolipoprotein D and lipocalin family protein
MTKIFMKPSYPLLACLLAVTCLVLVGCASVAKNPPPTARHVEVKRYLGRWYEIARLPMPFQRADEAAMAEYGINQNRTLSVHNIAVRQDGSEHGIRGDAAILNPPVNTKLAVRFNTWFGPLIPVPKDGNYWILYVDQDYRRAIVGTPKRKYLWILSRDPKISDQELGDLKNKSRKLGFNLSGLIMDPRP